ncbi:MAG: short chain dehydrogenase [Bacteroidetes bacterium]|nr:short chain dehydrogenase [Bacteroidota bacterium]
MKILIIGGNGTIGKRVKEQLEEHHEVIVAGRSTGDYRFNMESNSSIRDLLKKTSPLDAIISIAGEAKWDRFETLTEDDFYAGIRSKLMGQVNLVRTGKDFLPEGGSITLTSGILADEPELMTTIPAMVNGAIHSFVKAVNLELPAIRVNVVCSDVVEDSFGKYEDFFVGHTPVPMQKVADAYVRCVESPIRGEIIRLRE